MNLFFHSLLRLLGRSVSGVVMNQMWAACQAHFTSAEFSHEFWIGFVGVHREEVELWIIQYCIDNNL